MINIQQGQSIAENENIIVCSPSGDYNDFDLIEYCQIDNPHVALGAFQAQFVKYGGLVYQCNEPAELGDAILAVDPESTHSAASFVRMKNEMLKKFDSGSLQSGSMQEVVDKEKKTLEENKKIQEENNLMSKEPAKDETAKPENQNNQTLPENEPSSEQMPSQSEPPTNSSSTPIIETPANDQPTGELPMSIPEQTPISSSVPPAETVSEIVEGVKETVENLSEIIQENN